MGATYEKHQKERLKKFKKEYRDLYKKVVEDLGADRANEIQFLYKVALQSKEYIYFFEDPAHGFYYNLDGECIGEEDGGLFIGGHDALKNCFYQPLV